MVGVFSRVVKFDGVSSVGSCGRGWVGTTIGEATTVGTPITEPTVTPTTIQVRGGHGWDTDHRLT